MEIDRPCLRSLKIAPLPSTRTPRGGRHGLEFADPRTLMRIKNLQLRAQSVVEGFFAGIHRSPYHGFSVEFTEYRQYSPGDDLRYLDWRLYGRSDRYFVKRFEDETNLLCYLLVDSSRSMGYGSGDYAKHEYARTLAATIAYFLYLQRDAVGLVAFDDKVNEFLPPRHRPGHLRRLTGILQREPRGQGTNISAPLDQIAQVVRKRGLVVLISDLLADVQSLKKRLGLPPLTRARRGRTSRPRSRGAEFFFRRAQHVSRRGVWPPSLRRP